MINSVAEAQKRYLKYSRSPLRLKIIELCNTDRQFSIRSLDSIDVSDTRKHQMLGEAIALGFLMKVDKLYSNKYKTYLNCYFSDLSLDYNLEKK